MDNVITTMVNEVLRYTLNYHTYIDSVASDGKDIVEDVSSTPDVEAREIYLKALLDVTIKMEYDTGFKHAIDVRTTSSNYKITRSLETFGITYVSDISIINELDNIKEDTPYMVKSSTNPTVYNLLVAIEENTSFGTESFRTHIVTDNCVYVAFKSRLGYYTIKKV